MTTGYRHILSHGLPTEIAQRLGVEPGGRPLIVDGIEGEKTRAARYLDPLLITHPLAMTALGFLLDGAQEYRGNNRGPFVAKCMRETKPDAKYGPWCAGFASLCLNHTYGPQAPWILGARRLCLAVSDDSGVGKLAYDDLRAGDLVCWNRDGPDEGSDPWDDWSGHVGIVAHREQGMGVWIIEGNKGPYPAPVRVFYYTQTTISTDVQPFMFGARPMY